VVDAASALMQAPMPPQRRSSPSFRLASIGPRANNDRCRSPIAAPQTAVLCPVTLSQ
jgi:hypothetical protein